MGKNKWWQTLILVAVFGVISGIYFFDLDKHPLHSDEHEWVRRGVLFSELFFFDKNYSDPIWQNFESRDMPKLGQYMYGLWLRFIYQEKMTDVMERTDYNAGWKRADGYGLLWDSKYWWVNGTTVSLLEYQSAFRVIVTARYLSVFLVLVGLFIFYWFVRELLGFGGGILSVTLLMISASFYEVTRQALLDGPLFFGMMTAFIGIRLLAVKTERLIQEIGLVLLVAVLFGFGALIKLNGVLLLPAGFMAMLILKIRRQHENRVPRFLVSLRRYVVVGGLVFMMFWISDPMWWQNPIVAAVNMVETRVRLTRAQGIMEWARPLTSIVSRPIYVLEEYANKGWPGIKIVGPVYVEGFLMMLGLGSLLKRKKYQLNTPGQIFLIGNICWFLLVMNYLIIGVNRHTIILMPLLALLEAGGILEIWRVLANIFPKASFVSRRSRSKIRIQ